MFKPGESSGQPLQHFLQWILKALATFAIVFAQSSKRSYFTLTVACKLEMILGQRVLAIKQDAAEN